jgi:hypothetical protein
MFCLLSLGVQLETLCLKRQTFGHHSSAALEIFLSTSASLQTLLLQSVLWYVSFFFTAIAVFSLTKLRV